ncbi:MAG: hydantoinase B/oxoprolinase family protein [Chloroflexi bacterium]|nr:hydantoinase B/oxoprolinase family protein [Chloroflexota bacterium]
MTGNGLDPLTLEIIWQRLITVADQMSTTLARTAFSTTITASNDYGCVLIDADAQCIAHAQRSLPIFNRTMPYTTGLILDRFGCESIRPGDIFISNDPWENAGHNPDITVITPFFNGGALVGFAASIAHHADVGGAIDTNQVSDSYEEGLLIPLVRLYCAGEINQTVLDFVEANVRLPTAVIGDIHAQVAANQTGAERCLALLDEYGLPDLRAISTEIRSRSEQAMRKAIAALPDGVYCSKVVVDELDQPLQLVCALEVRDDEIFIDFSGTSPQQPRGAINVTFTFTHGQISYALKATLLPDVPGNDGCYRPIHASAPAGCILNAQKPASVSQRHRIGAHIFGAVIQALAEVLPDRVIAGSGFLVSTRVFASEADDTAISHSYLFSAGGMGANARTNGISTVQAPALAGAVPVELFEIAVPILTRSREFIPDSGGGGRRRGGLAQRMELGLLPGYKGTATVSVHAAGQHVPPFGLHGGEGGSPAQILRDGEILTRAEKVRHASALPLTETAQTVGFETAAGGGYGPPKERAPEQVKADVRDGLVSFERAAETYGVILDSESLRVDVKATEAKRRDM